MYVQAVNTRLLSSSTTCCFFLYSLQTELLNAVLSGDALHTDSILRSARVDVDERLKVSMYIQLELTYLKLVQTFHAHTFTNLT